MSQKNSPTNPLNERSNEKAHLQPTILLLTKVIVILLTCGYIYFDTDANETLAFNDLIPSPLEMNLSHLLVSFDMFLNLAYQVQMLMDMLQVVALLLPRLAQQIVPLSQPQTMSQLPLTHTRQNPRKRCDASISELLEIRYDGEET